MQLKEQHHTTSISHYTNNALHSNNIRSDQVTASEGQGNRKIKKIVDKIYINKIPISRSSDNKEDGWDTVIKTRYGRVIRKPDRLAY